MTDGADGTTADLDRAIRERLAAAGPFDPADYAAQVLRESFALAQRWHSALLAEAPPSQPVPRPTDKPQ